MRQRGVGLFVALGITMLTMATAVAQDDRARIRDLNRQGLEAYHNLELDQAKTLLERALQIAERARITSGPEIAQTYLGLGIVSIGGFQDTGRGLDYFVRAIEADPSVQIETSLSSPEIQAKFQLARARAGSPRTPAAGTPASGSSGTAAAAASASPTPAPSGADGTSPTSDAAADAQECSGEDAECPASDRAERTRIVGDACTASLECEEGLVCDAGICTAPENPAFASDGRPPRFFFHYGYSIGLGYANTGMRAADTIPYDPRFKPAGWNANVNGAYAPPGYSEEQWANVIATRYASYVSPDESPDDDCNVATERYCVRLTKAGFAPTGGLRFALGYWLVPRLGVSSELRVQTRAGVGTFGRILWSVRAHVMLTRPAETGFLLQAFVGGGFGQMQLRPTQGRYQGPDIVDPNTNVVYIRQGDAIRRPWIETGLGSVQVGGIATYRFRESLGMYLQPVAYVFFPSTTFALDLTFGAEVAF